MNVAVVEVVLGAEEDDGSARWPCMVAMVVLLTRDGKIADQLVRVGRPEPFFQVSLDELSPNDWGYVEGLV
jgi:hypothetical protein